MEAINVNSSWQKLESLITDFDSEATYQLQNIGQSLIFFRVGEEEESETNDNMFNRDINEIALFKKSSNFDIYVRAITNSKLAIQKMEE